MNGFVVFMENYSSYLFLKGEVYLNTKIYFNPYSDAKEKNKYTKKWEMYHRDILRPKYYI